MPKFASILTVAALAAAIVAPAQAETIKIGLSVPLSGGAAAWGRGSAWACDAAAAEINAAGGVNVGSANYTFECLAYDNKYSAAEGTKVAQTMLNRDRVNYVGGVVGTPPFQAIQSLSERQGVLLFTSSWATTAKGPNWPLTMYQGNTPKEILPTMVGYIAKTYPDAKRAAILVTSDAVGKETEPQMRAAWEAAGREVVASDEYDRGTTDFQPIALRLNAANPDIVDVGSLPPADAGLVLKELKALGWSGLKTWGAGTGIEDIMATGGDAVDGVLMGLAVPFGATDLSAHLDELNETAKVELGQSLNAIHIGFYDTVYAIKAGIEAAGSIESEAVVKALREITFDTVYGGKGSYGGEKEFGIATQVRLPVFVTQLQGDKLVSVGRIDPTHD